VTGPDRPSDPRDWYFEDFAVGDRFEFGPVEVDEAEVIEFARRYDPQYFHTDPEAARRSIFGGLVASGWHTCGLTMRLLVENLLGTDHGLGSPGIDELRFPAPVRPGARLMVALNVVELVPSRSRPDRGMIRQHVETTDVSDATPVTVLSMRTMGLWKRRPIGI